MFQIIVVLLFTLLAAKAIIDSCELNKFKRDVDVERDKSTHYIQLVREGFETFGKKLDEAKEDFHEDISDLTNDIIDIEKELDNINKAKMLESALSTAATFKDIEVTHITRAMIKKVYGEEGLPQEVKDAISKEQDGLMHQLMASIADKYPKGDSNTNIACPDHAGEHKQPRKATKVIDFPKVEV